MRIHETISGQEIKYPEPEPKLERFLKRVQALVDDRKATEDDLVALVYGQENPILDQTIFPERGAVTREVLDNPVYQVLTDQLARKRMAQTGTDPAKLAAKFTLTVNEAAERKGVSPDAIRKAIRDRRLPSWRKAGEYYLEPRSLDAIELGKRGPIPERISPLEYDAGYSPDLKAFLRLKSADGETPTDAVHNKGSVARWRRAAVLTGGFGGARYFEIEPDPSAEEELKFQHYYVRGRFRIARKENNSKAAREAFEAFKAS